MNRVFRFKSTISDRPLSYYLIEWSEDTCIHFSSTSNTAFRRQLTSIERNHANFCEEELI